MEPLYAKACHAAVANRGATIRIPDNKNEQPWKDRGAGARARNEILRTTLRLGRTIWKKSSGDRGRNVVETKERCFRLLCKRVIARDFDREVAEMQIRVALLNRFTQRGTPQAVRVE